MTTIAYKNGIVAADGLACMDNLIVSNNEKKIFELNRGIVAGCGNFAEINRMVHWLASGSNINTDQPDVSALVVLFTKKNITVFEKNFYFHESLKKFFAWGSGDMIAMGAMMRGANAVEAVQTACKLDIHSGGKIQWRKV